jgi:beta-glucosidase
LKKFSNYKGIKDIIITESGVCLDDRLTNGRVSDSERIEYFKKTLSYIYKAQQNGISVKGLFIWTLSDNFEWVEGYKPRFGLVYVNHKTLEKTVKESGFWFREYLAE